MPDAAPKRRRHRTPEALIDEVLPYVLETGLTDFSLRSAAAELGTSHKVLLHHFGSRPALIAAILRRVRERLLAETQDADPRTMLTNAWNWYAGHPAEAKLLVQGLGLGIIDPADYDTVVTDSIQQYMPGARTANPALARLVLAALRGLQIDQAITGDTAGTNEAFRQLQQLLSAIELTEEPTADSRHRVEPER